MFRLPTYFKVASEAKPLVKTTWETTTLTTEQKLQCRAPNSILGSSETPNEGFSPEDMYAMALANSFVATFKVLAEQSKLYFESIKVLTTLGIDQNNFGTPWLATADFKVTLINPNSPDTAKRILQQTTECCLVLNSVNTTKHFQFEIVS